MFGEHLPESRPGCGSLTVMPGVKETLDARFGDLPLNSRTIEIGEFDDPIEQAFERGWSDGLPIVPPTGEDHPNAFRDPPKSPGGSRPHSSQSDGVHG